MRRGFSVIELIFVMIIIAILAGIGFYSYKTKHLYRDADYIYMRILEAKYQGINYDKRGLSSSNAIGCIDLKGLKKMAKMSHYTIKSEVINYKDILCFDSFGRAHFDDNLTQKASLLTAPQKFLQLRYRNHTATFTLLPQSGYVIIKIN